MARSNYWERVHQYADYYEIRPGQARREAGFKAWYGEFKELSSRVQRGWGGTQEEYIRLGELYDDIGIDIEEEFAEDGDTP
jgi:hypothetical protein